MAIWYVALAAGLFTLGFLLGRIDAICSLLIGVDDPGRTPHYLGGRFFYLVPESEYVRLRCRGVNFDRVAPHDSDANQ